MDDGVVIYRWGWPRSELLRVQKTRLDVLPNWNAKPIGRISDFNTCESEAQLIPLHFHQVEPWFQWAIVKIPP